MRKRRAPATGVEVVGVRTRSRTTVGAASGGVVAPKRSKVLPPAAEPGSGCDAGSCCYLQLRSRMVFKSWPPSSPDQKDPAGHGAPLAAVLSRCSSTASSAAQEFTEVREIGNIATGILIRKWSDRHLERLLPVLVFFCFVLGVCRHAEITSRRPRPANRDADTTATGWRTLLSFLGNLAERIIPFPACS